MSGPVYAVTIYRHPKKTCQKREMQHTSNDVAHHKHIHSPNSNNKKQVSDEKVTKYVDLNLSGNALPELPKKINNWSSGSQPLFLHHPPTDP